jgi:hypothetical protein
VRPISSLSLSLSLSRVCLCGARRPSVRPHTIRRWVVSGTTLDTTFFCLWSLSANCRKTMYCMQASSETIDSSCVWESQNLWEELVEANPIYIFPCCRCFAFRRWVVD